MRVLLATDSSEASLRAAELIGKLGVERPDLTVTVLHVVPLPDVLTPAGATAAPLTMAHLIDDYQNTQVPIILETTKETVGLPDERIRTQHLVGVPADAILAEAKREQYDLIAMGRRGLSPLKELLVGSVSQAVLHRATCPVLIVP